METQELSPAALAAIEKVEKLLALARDAGATEGEASNAMNLATRILEQHNLDMALVEQNAGRKNTSKRADDQKGGGLYKWQRQVWEHTAKLNMCRYFSIRGLSAGSKYEQRVIGRAENVLMTNIMASYLQQAIERMAAGWAKDNGYSSRFVREAIIFREGMAENICARLNTLRWERLEESRRKQEEARKAHSGDGSGTALVLASVIQTEEDLNTDYLHGWEPGTTARRRAENEARYAVMVAQQTEAARQKAARRLIDPQFDLECRAEEAAEAKRAAREEAKWQRTYSRRTGGARETAEDRRRSHWAHGEGRDAGDRVSLDQQVSGGDARRLK
jgi:hypothetical protein